MEQTFDPKLFFCQLHKLHLSSALTANPICSMYGISNTYIYHKDPPNAGKYSIEHMGFAEFKVGERPLDVLGPGCSQVNHDALFRHGLLREGMPPCWMQLSCEKTWCPVGSRGIENPWRNAKVWRQFCFCRSCLRNVESDINLSPPRPEPYRNCWLFTSSQTCKTLQRFLSERKSPNP